jgi:hypothetical protein
VVCGLDSSDLGLFLCDALGDEGAREMLLKVSCDVDGGDVLVVLLLLLLVLSSPADEGLEVAAALEAHGGDQALDLRAREGM